MKDKTRVHVKITGRVQGVCYRMETKRVAVEKGVKGWVRNRIDGSVEGVFEGDKEKVNEVLDWCNDGPLLANVEQIEVAAQDYGKEFTDFTIL